MAKDEATGVEMEALVSCTIAALTIYDMCKALTKSLKLEPQTAIVIEHVNVLGLADEQVLVPLCIHFQTETVTACLKNNLLDTLIRSKVGTLVPNRIFVGGLPPNTSEDELRQFFSKFGQVKDVKVIIDRIAQSKGTYGFVTFESQEVAERIINIEADTLVFQDRKLNISFAIKKNQSAARAEQLSASSLFNYGANPTLPFNYSPNFGLLPYMQVPQTNLLPSPQVSQLNTNVTMDACLSAASLFSIPNYPSLTPQQLSVLQLAQQTLAARVQGQQPLSPESSFNTIFPSQVDQLFNSISNGLLTTTEPQVSVAKREIVSEEEEETVPQKRRKCD
ncbi:hypothetical protein Ciccas_002302 [Cichlidogyrus casuarinus]|uniref:RRM domain-containing protein n=1 Tax=Cichlidogyrus casuarinus TaxID=1844966 RepID=A0ABD2QI82_9PLAT